MFEQICEKQTKGEVGKLGYIHFVFLRTNLLANEDTLVAYGYDKNGYFGQEYILGTINVSYFMDKFRNLWKELEHLSLKYMGKVTK